MSEGDLDVMVNHLHELGYKAKKVGDFIESSTAGILFFIDANAKNILQFNALFKNEQGEEIMPGVNEFNRSFKIFKIFLDPDADIVLTADFYYVETPLQSLRNWLGLFEYAVSAMRQILYRNL